MLKPISFRVLCIMRIAGRRLWLLVLRRMIQTRLHLRSLLLGLHPHPDQHLVHCAALFHGDASNRPY